MHVIRIGLALLLGAALLLALPVVQAKKPQDEDSSGRDHPRYEQRQAPRNDGDPRSDLRAPERDSRGHSERSYDDNRGNEQRGTEDRSRWEPRGLSLSEAVSQAERSTGGRVLSAEPRDEGGRAYYRVKVLSPNGRVQVLYIDAR